MLVADITTDVIEQYRQARMPRGATGTNRHLELLRSMFNWATSNKRKLAADNPFLDGTRAAVKMLPEMQRRRRLQSGEAERLLAACNTHLWAAGAMRDRDRDAPRRNPLVAMVAGSARA